MGKVQRVAVAHKATVRKKGPPDNKKTQVTGITWVDMWRRGRDSPESTNLQRRNPELTVQTYTVKVHGVEMARC